MGDLRFEWDPEKNKQNQRKHGVTFEEAESVFVDEHGLFMSDPDHSDVQDRFILLGLSSGAADACGVPLLSRGQRQRPHHFGAEGASVRGRAVQPQVETMRDHYDFSKAKPNPYAKRLMKQVTLRVDQRTIGYFQKLAEEMGVPYQSLINLYLRDCAAKGKRLSLRWKPAA